MGAYLLSSNSCDCRDSSPGILEAQRAREGQLLERAGGEAGHEGGARGTTTSTLVPTALLEGPEMAREGHTYLSSARRTRHASHEGGRELRGEAPRHSDRHNFTWSISPSP